MEQNYNLASAFEEIALTMEGSKLSEDVFASSEKAFTYVTNKLKITNNQAFILAVMLHHAGKSMETKDFSDYAETSPIRMMRFQKDFDGLVNKGMIVCVKPTSLAYWQQTFTLSAGIFKAVKYNKKFSPSTYKELSASDVLDMMQNLLHECDYNNITYNAMVEQLEKLITDTQHINMCRQIKELEMRPADMVMLLIGIVGFVCSETDYICTSAYEDILPGLYKRLIVRQFKNKTSFLCVNGLMEATDSDFDTYHLTDKAKKDLLSEFGVEIDSEESKSAEEESTDTEKETVSEKKMFYNRQEYEQIDRLKNLLDKDKFEEVQQRMRVAGMKPGFACLFYGSPGTGKTETVLQLARSTGREIIQVNVANLRNMYVGESEKNTQRVFDNYKEKLEESDLTPILLFNEADGIFGNRYTGVNDAVNQMENTIQNIILQNMENFEGILIATTNLTQNMDKAFERRFLYKIEFNKPKAEVRQQIWMSVLPNISANDASILATRYEFSGGQIANVAKRLTIDEVLYDRKMDIEYMKRVCDEEQIRKPMGIKKLSA